jgi:hypothetical protein
MKFIKDLIRQFIIMLIAWFMIITAYWALTNVNNWDILSASQWNEIVWKLNSVDSTWTGLVSKNYVDSAVGAWGGSMKVYKSDGTTVLGNYMWFTYMISAYWAFVYQYQSSTGWIVNIYPPEFHNSANLNNRTLYFRDWTCTTSVWWWSYAVWQTSRLNQTSQRVWVNFYSLTSMAWNYWSNLWRTVNWWACTNLNTTNLPETVYILYSYATSACWTWPCIIK